MMGLIAPLALLFGLTLPAIILLWLLKRRRQEHEVSSTYLWRQVLRDVRANAPWQRLVAQFLLMLQLIAAALIVLALARPHLTGISGGRAHLILLLDGSGSMQSLAADGSNQTRFELARAEAIKSIQDLKSQDRVSLVLAGRVPRLVASATSKDRALNSLYDSAPTHESANWGQALSMVASIGRDQSSATILVLSDALFDPATLDTLGSPTVLRTVGEAVENLSIRLTLRPGAQERPPAALARVVNHGRQQVEVEVEILADGQLIDRRMVDVPPGGAAEVIWREVPVGATVFTARIAHDDALAIDNQDHAVQMRSRRSRALLVSTANLFLEQGLKLRDDVELVRTTPQNYVPGDFQLYVFDGWMPPVLPLGALLLINPPDDNPVMAMSESSSITSIRPSSQTNPLTAYLPLDDVHIAKGRPLHPPTWANSLLESPEGTLLAAGHKDGRPTAVLGFDLHESDFPLRVAFPVLMQNLLNWLVPVTPSALRATAGESLPLSLDPLATAATVLTPDRRTVNIAPPLPAPPWTDTAQPGVYTLTQTSRQGERVSHFVVEFPSGESQSESKVAVDRGELAASGATRPPVQEVWYWVGALALAITGLEWWVYIRGI